MILYMQIIKINKCDSYALNVYVCHMEISYKHIICIIHNYMMFEAQKHGKSLPDVGGSTVCVGIIIIIVATPAQ